MLGRVAVDAVTPLGRLRVGGENDDGGAGRNGTGGGRLQATLVIGEGAAGAGDLTGRIRIDVRGRSGSGGSFLNLGGNHQVGRDVLQDKTGHIVAVRLDPDAVDRPVFHGLIGFDSHAADILEGEGFGGLIHNRVAAGVDRIHGDLIRLDRDDLRTGRLFRNFGGGGACICLGVFVRLGGLLRGGLRLRAGSGGVVLRVRIHAVPVDVNMV